MRSDNLDNGSLRSGITRAVFASGAFQVTARILTLLLAVLIARALEPGEVGLLGLTSIIVSVLSVVASCADTGGVVGRRKESHTEYAAAATVVRAAVTALLVGLVLTSLPVLSHLLAGQDGNERQLSALVNLLLWQLAFELAATFPRVMLLRRLQFIWIAVAGVVQVMAHVALALALLWNGYGAMGVVMASLAGGALGAAVLWCGLGRDWHAIGDARINARVLVETLLGTGKVVAARSTGYLNCRADNLLVASTLGPTAMSFYGMAWTASRQTIGLLDETLDSVLTPALTRIRDDRERVGGMLREAVRNYYLLLLPVSAWLFVAAPELVTLVLGEKWLPLVPCLRLMTVTILACPLMTGYSSLLTATGRAHLFGVAAAAQLAALVILIPVLSRRWGILGAGLADLAGVVVLAVALGIASERAVPRMRWDILRTAGVPCLGGLVAVLMAWPVRSLVSDLTLRLLCEGLVVCFAYVSALWCFGGRASLHGLVVALREALRRTVPVTPTTHSSANTVEREAIAMGRESIISASIPTRERAQ